MNTNYNIPQSKLTQRQTSAYNKLNPEDTLDINYYTNTKVPEHLLYEAIRGMQHTGHKLDTKLKFYKKFDEEIKRKEEMIKEKLEENIEK